MSFKVVVITKCCVPQAPSPRVWPSWATVKKAGSLVLGWDQAWGGVRRGMCKGEGWGEFFYKCLLFLFLS